jgi:hypothetical protein
VGVDQDVTGFAELRIDHGNIRVSKFGLNCADNGRLQPTRHRNIVGVYSPAAACKLAIQVENMAEPAAEDRIRQKFAFVVKESLSVGLSRIAEFSPVTITRFTSTVLIKASPVRCCVRTQ